MEVIEKWLNKQKKHTFWWRCNYFQLSNLNDCYKKGSKVAADMWEPKKGGELDGN